MTASTARSRPSSGSRSTIGSVRSSRLGLRPRARPRSSRRTALPALTWIQIARSSFQKGSASDRVRTSCASLKS